ncbi:MAG: hypothetical protein KAH38_03300, partial [Candidatus Hydrogenedentes bacterium]|nr:hypothetical protein [Candidatus Hydrogenedentota bacterium]
MFWGSKKKDDSKTLKKTSASLKKNNDTTRRTTTSTDTQSRNPAKSQTAFGKKIIHRDDLPQLLVKEAHISEQDVRDALKAQEETGVFFGEILANKGILESQSLVGFLAKHCKIPHIGLLDYLIDKSLLALIPEKLCWEHHLIPVDKLGKNLTVAMVNPLNNAALRSVREICPELRIKPILCSNEHFKTVAENLFGKEEKEDKTNSSEVPAPCSESMEEVILPINNVSSEISADKNSEEEIPVAVEEEGHAPLP